MSTQWIRYACWACMTCMLYGVQAQDAWELQRGAVTNYKLEALYFIDAQQGWAVGEGGTIVHTTNGGENWNLQYSDGGGNRFHDIHFIDALTGWAVGLHSKTALRTEDGGNIWVKQETGIEPGHIIQNIQFFDATTGWLWAGNGYKTSYLMETTDGGDTWVRKGTLADGSRYAPWLWDIYFVDAMKGWAVGQIERESNRGVEVACIFRTVDGGVTWIDQQTAITQQGVLRAVHFADAMNGWAVGRTDGILSASQTNTYIVHTSDGGVTWEEQTSGKTMERLWHNDVFFLDAMRGWVVNSGGTIWYTVNGGARWEKQGVVHADYFGVQFVDASTGWAVGRNGVILHSIDGGVSWTAQSRPHGESLYDITFIGTETGWTVGQGGLILHTTNGGDDWNRQTSAATHTLRGLHFLDANTGWIVGHEGTILHTEDRGATWTKQPSGTRSHLAAVSFVDANTGWAVGEENILLHTEDGGASWVSQDNPYTGEIGWNFSDVHFANATTGWVGTGRAFNGGILSTTDGGATWTALDDRLISLRGQVVSLSFLDENIGYAGSYIPIVGTARLYETQNGGLSWDPIATFNHSFSDVHAVNTDTVYFAAGGLLGLSLPRQNSVSGLQVGAGAGFYAVHFLDSRTGWMVGDNGVIVKTVRGGRVVPFIRASADSYAVDHRAQSVELRVASNVSWELTDGAADWISFETAAGNTNADRLSLLRNQVVTVHFAAYTGSGSREAQLTLRTRQGSPVAERILRVEQVEAALIHFSAEVVRSTLAAGVTLMSLPLEEGFFNVQVRSNVSWAVDVSAAWVSARDGGGMPIQGSSGDALIKVPYAENELIIARDAELHFTLQGATVPRQRFDLRQLASPTPPPPALTLEPTGTLPTWFPSGMSRYAFELHSNTSWSLGVSDSWVGFVDGDDVSVTSGTGDRDLILVVDANHRSVSRRASITGTTTAGTPVVVLVPRVVQQAASSLTGLHEADGPGGLDSRSNVQLYPNPAARQVTIVVGEEAILRLRNRHGEVLSTHNMSSGQVLELALKEYEVVEDFGEGVYFVEVQTARGRIVRRLAIK